MSTIVTLNGKQVSIPKNFFDVGVKASFGENIQANVTTENFTFILDAYQEIIEWVNGGRQGGVGIFEGIPFTITQSDKATPNQVIFKGILDLQDELIIQPNLGQAQTKIRQDDSLNTLDSLIEPLDFGYLKSLGVITPADYVDIEYVVNKPDNGIETITTFITIYLLSKQLGDSILAFGKDGAVISAWSAVVSIPTPGAVGAAVYAVIVSILNIAYAATLLVLIINFGVDLFNILVQPQRTHKGIRLKTLIEKTCKYVGYTLETTIEDLDALVYLPSNFSVDEFGIKNVFSKVGVINEGIPRPTDPGYTCLDLFEICRNAFNARFAIVGNTVQFHTESSPYWISQSGWQKPIAIKDFASRGYRYNTDELKSSIFVEFQTDISDEYTINNYSGTSFQVLTDAKSVSVEVNKTIKNIDRVTIPLALGNRKESLNGLESSLASIANLFDSIGSVFGGKPNLAKKVKNKVGVLQVSNNNHSVAKLLWMPSGRIPNNHRDLFSAKTLWEKYHVEKSFVSNNFSRQRRYVEGEVIPFGLSSFVTLLNNSYFRDENGRIGKIVDLEWVFSKDYATISYWIEDVYTTNLKETFIEPE